MSQGLISRVCIAAAALILLSGCENTPFVPIAVPNAMHIKPERPVAHISPAQELVELEKLQRAAVKEYVIAPNDVFAIAIENQPTMSRPSVMVMPDGSISIAPIGSVKLAGLTLPQASEVLNQKYKRYLRECNVVLEPVTLKNHTFTISGMVVAPGIYPIIIGTTRLVDAIAMAKGLVTTTAGGANNMVILSDLKNAYISRNGQILPVDFVKALEKGDALYNIPIMSGDYIYVPSLETERISIMGEVYHPLCMIYQPNLTLAQLVGLAGGLKDSNATIIKVIRGGLKDPEVFNVDITELMHGRLMDFALKPQDIVYVPRDPLSKWNVIIREIQPTFQLLNSMAGPFGNPSMFYNND